MKYHVKKEAPPLGHGSASCDGAQTYGSPGSRRNCMREGFLVGTIAWPV